VVKPPSRPKMALLTLVGVYPLTMLFPKVVLALMPSWPAWLKGLMTAALIVVSLAWVVMPALTRVFRSWLFPQHHGDHQ
jgi:antibiotic biosynthesis monooxygenase (ABM) superfamily enzyme